MDERFDFPNPDINPDPQQRFPSAAITKRIVALLDERAAALPGPPEPRLPPLAPRAREPLVRHPRPTGYVAADDFS